MPTSVQIIAAQTVHHIVAGMYMFDNEENLYMFLYFTGTAATRTQN